VGYVSSLEGTFLLGPIAYFFKGYVKKLQLGWIPTARFQWIPNPHRLTGGFPGFSRSGEAVCVLSAALGPLAPCELLARPRMEEGGWVVVGDSRAQGFQR